MGDFETFRASSLDTACIGLDTDDLRQSPCTPVGADIIGWTEPGGSHFCLVDGFGGVVFAVVPGACRLHPAYPVAENFSAFLGLVLACGGAGDLTCAWCESRSRFEQRLADKRLSFKQRSVLRAIANTYHPPVISDPYGYLEARRRGFDPRALAFSPAMASQTGIENPGFSVSLSGGFLESRPKETPGKQMALDAAFSWGGGEWLVPKLYLCKDGLVVDFCVRFENDSGALASADLSLTLNGKVLPQKRGFGTVWYPSEDNGCEAAALMDRYGCDREKSWFFLRRSFLWYGKRRPAMQTLTLTLQAMPAAVHGPQFRVSGPGEEIVLSHPSREESYTLTVRGFTQEVLDANFLYDYPKHYALLRYTLSPDLPDTAFAVQDCAENDPGPEPIFQDGAAPEACVGIIGGRDGPTAVFLSTANGEKGIHMACSSFHYAPVEAVTWRMDFREKPWEDRRVVLL